MSDINALAGMIEGLRSLIDGVAQHLKRRMQLIVARGKVTAVDNSGPVMTLQFKTVGGVVRDKVESLQPYGLEAFPDDGADELHCAVLADPSHLVAAVTSDRRYRPTGLLQGEVAVYSKFGNNVTMKQNGDVDVVSPNNVNLNATGKVTVTAPSSEFTGDVKVDGKLSVSKKATFGSSASFSGAGKNVTVAAGVGLLVITPGELKIAGVVVVAP